MEFRIWQVTSEHRGDHVGVEYVSEHETPEHLAARLKRHWPDSKLKYVRKVVGDYNAAKAGAMWHRLELHRQRTAFDNCTHIVVFGDSVWEDIHFNYSEEGPLCERVAEAMFNNRFWTDDLLKEIVEDVKKKNPLHMLPIRFSIYRVTSPERGSDVAVEYSPEHETMYQFQARIKESWPNTVLEFVTTFEGDYNAAQAAAMWYRLHLDKETENGVKKWQTGIDHDYFDNLRDEVSCAMNHHEFSNNILQDIAEKVATNISTRTRVICGRCGAKSNKIWLLRHQRSDKCKNHGKPKPKPLTDKQKAVKIAQKKKEFNKKQAEKVRCPICGKLSTKRHLVEHQKSKKCKAKAAEAAAQSDAAFVAFAAECENLHNVRESV